MKALHECIWVGNVLSNVANFILPFTCRALGHFQVTLLTPYSVDCKSIVIDKLTLTFRDRHLLQDLTTVAGYWSIASIEIICTADGDYLANVLP